MLHEEDTKMSQRFSGRNSSSGNGEEGGEGGRAAQGSAGLDLVKGRDKEGGPGRGHLRLTAASG